MNFRLYKKQAKTESRFEIEFTLYKSAPLKGFLEIQKRENSNDI